MAYMGGLRARLIKDSLYYMVRTCLVDLGWFDSGRQHQTVKFNSQPVDPLTEVTFNTVAIGDLGTRDSEGELGSNLTERVWTMFVDVFAEDETIGLHLARDLQDILEGRFNTISRTRPIVDVYDYQQATPPVIFTCQIEGVAVDRAHDFPNPWQKNWFSVSFDVVDTFNDEVTG